MNLMTRIFGEIAVSLAVLFFGRPSSFVRVHEARRDKGDDVSVRGGAPLFEGRRVKDNVVFPHMGT